MLTQPGRSGQESRRYLGARRGITGVFEGFGRPTRRRRSLTRGSQSATYFFMKTTVTTTEAQANLPRLLRELPAARAVTITNHGRIAGFLVSTERMEAIIETMEILGNAEAMKAINDFEAGRSPGRDLSCLDE